MPPLPFPPSRRFAEAEALRRAAIAAQKIRHEPEAGGEPADESAAYAALSLAGLVTGLIITLGILVLA